MSLNWKEIDLILSEWTLVGGKIQQVLQPTPQSLFLEIYSSKSNNSPSDDISLQKLQFVSIQLENQAVRLHTTSKKAKKTKVAQRFQQLLQARIVGKYIEEITHIHQDRIIKFTLINKTHPEPVLCLWVQLWSGQANIILTSPDNTIIDLAFRRPRKTLMPKSLFMVEPPSNTSKKDATQIREWEASSFNEYIETIYSERNVNITFEKQLQQITNAFNKQASSLSQRKQTLEKQRELAEQYKEYSNYGNLILSNLDKISQFDTSLTLSSHNNLLYRDEEIVIPLNPDKSPIENSAYYFALSKKSIEIEKAIKSLEKSLQVEQKIQEEIKIKLENHNLIFNEKQRKWLYPNKNAQAVKQKDKSKKPPIKLMFTDGPYIIMIGRNKKENDVILRHYVKGNDMWMHVRGNSGAYVFIRTSRNKSFSLDILKRGAQLAALFSKAANEKHLDVYYTEVKYLKRIKNEIGLVTPMRDNNLQIQFDIQETKQYLEKLQL